MTAFLLVVPWLAVRHVVPALAGGDGAARAAHVAFGEGDGAARVAYGLLTAAAVLLPLALAVRAEGGRCALRRRPRARGEGGGAPLRARGGAVVPRAARGAVRDVHGARAPLPVSVPPTPRGPRTRCAWPRRRRQRGRIARGRTRCGRFRRRR